jgi:hypothetical protein
VYAAPPLTLAKMAAALLIAQFLTLARNDSVIPENVSSKLELAWQRESVRICRYD